MCTSLAALSCGPLFGRNLDLEYSFGEQVVITPRRFVFSFHLRPDLPEHFAMIGMATVARDYPLYAEAMNEQGLYMAGLNFPGNAYYPAPAEGDTQAVTPYELIPLVLGSCANLAQARQLLSTLRLAAIPFAPGYPLAPLHWHIADASGCLVMEATRDEIHLYDDPVGVLTNNPPYPLQLANLNNYMHLSARPPENRFAPALDLRAVGQGMGAIGLPGDWSPQSRFVRACFLKENSLWGNTPQEAVTQFFHILNGVAMVRGCVITPEEKPDITTYSCCIDASRCIYYYKTYGNNRIAAVYLHGENLDGEQLRAYPLEQEQQIYPVNVVLESGN